MYEFPLKHKTTDEEIHSLNKESYPITIKNKIITLLTDFLDYKNKYGNDIEKEVYKKLDVSSFLTRIIKDRPLTFMGRGDKWLLKSGEAGYGRFVDIGTEKQKGELVLSKYMSYEELEISVFISMSNLTRFINNGSRQNMGKVGHCEDQGIYIAQVGARFEERFRMEWKHMIIDPEQNTWANGYGKDNPNPKLKMWAKFYDVDYFPLFTEITESDRYIPIPGNRSFLFDTEIYSKRIQVNAHAFLKEANIRSKKSNKKAFCHVVGLGLGVWQIHKIQEEITIKVYLDLLRKLDLNIDTLYFGWFYKPEWFRMGMINGINIQFGKREPAEDLNNPELLLVANYAWDSNSYPGNEYWMGYLKCSGDPAAACCSLISYTQNPDINKLLVGNNVRFLN
jgi:hypothetical protein